MKNGRKINKHLACKLQKNAQPIEYGSFKIQITEPLYLRISKIFSKPIARIIAVSISFRNASFNMKEQAENGQSRRYI